MKTPAPEGDNAPIFVDGVPEGLPEDSGQTFDPGRPKLLVVASAANPTEVGPASRPPSSGTPGQKTPSAEIKFEGDLGERFTPQGYVNKGGFGEVWKALQVSLDRVIAVKKIRSDLRAAANPTRRAEIDIVFRREAYTAASLEHPNIVPIYDLGDSENGEPILAMKLVQGDPWDAVIERDFISLEVGAFLARHLPILIAASNAVAYSHYKGIIHRDLKPSQVMVGRFGEVLLMDWGLAMRVGDPTEPGNDHFTSSAGIATSATATNPAGTPAFMAPEQTVSSTEELGPWTDVFLLGGTLYFLLTGMPPHHGGSRMETYFRAKNCKIRHPQEASPDREVPKELAEIALDAMAKDPLDRIPNVEAFVARLNNYLSGESRRRESEETVAAVEETLKHASGDYALYSECVVNLGNARALWLANPAIRSLEERVFSEFAESALANRDLTLAAVQAERLPLGLQRTGLLTRIEQTERTLKNQKRERRIALATVGVMVILFAVMGYRFALEQARARAIADAARTQADLARAEAVASRERAEGLTDFMLTRLREQLKPIGRLKLLDDVASEALEYYNSVGRANLGPEALRKQSIALFNIGDVSRDTGRSDEALSAYESALERRVELAKSSPNDARAAIDVIATRNAIARLYLQRGDLPRAETESQDALRASEALAVKAPDNTDNARQLATSHTNLALIQMEQGKPEDATASIRKAISVSEAAFTSQPKLRDLQIDCAAGYSNLGLILQRSGDPQGAIGAHRTALALREEIESAQPTNTANQFSMARTLLALVPLHGMRGEIEQAREASDRALALLERLVAIDPLNLEWEQGLSAALNVQAMMRARGGDQAGAEEALNRALEIREYLVAQDGSNAAWLRDLSVAYNQLASVAGARGDEAASLAFLRKDLAIAERLSKLDATNEVWRHDLALSYQSVGERLASLHQDGEALTQLRKGLPVFRQIFESDPKSLAAANDLAWAHVVLGEVLARLDQPDTAKEEWEAAVLVLAPFLPEPEGAEPGTIDTYARALLHLGRVEDARPWVAALLAAEWDEEGLLSLAREHGLAP
jgi:serine/threonine protein kinase